MGVHPGAQHGKKRMNIISPLWERIKANDKLHLAWCVSGVVGCLMLYGVLQERIMTRPFGEPGKDAEHFKYSLFLVLCNRLTSCAVAIFGLVTLGKCAKMIPVMIWGIMIMRKKYTLKDFGIAVAVTGGCTLFLLTGSVQSKVSASLWDSQVYGLLLMLGYLGFDGFTSTFQDKLFKGFQMTTYNQILYTTLWSSLLSCFGLITSGQMPLAMQFVRQHPEALSQIIMLSAAASTGALFISYTIKTFGALIFATIMTTRQFLSILLSCFLFLHPLSLGQWVGTTIVFGALYYQGFAKGKDKDKQHREAPKQSPDEEAQELLANKADTAEFKSEGPK